MKLACVVADGAMVATGGMTVMDALGRGFSAVRYELILVSDMAVLYAGFL